MKVKEKNGSQESKKCTSSKILYIAAVVVGLLAVALLIDNIMLFRGDLAQYVGQGYPSADVLKKLIPAQLLPGIFEPIAVYGGMALLLCWVGIINQKVSKCLTAETEDGLGNGTEEENADPGQGDSIEEVDTAEGKNN